jgi:DNA-binding SARP family transcriptional activator/Tfp pilus assembly protein PilF
MFWKSKAVMEFRVLGPTELWSRGQLHNLGPARERSVLAILLLTPRMIVPAETLIDRLWGSEPPRKARDSLSAYVARLRASLRGAVGDDVTLAGRLSGYALEVDPEVIDVHLFRMLRRQADAAAAIGDHCRAAELLREADDLWRGPPLAGLRGEWMARMRVSLQDERRAAILQRIGCEFELGRHADLVGELRGLLAQHPLDEALVAHQMEALYRSGRQADALRLYRETRDRLVAEQGTEPSFALAELHQRILRQDQPAAGSPSGRAGHAALRDTLPLEPGELDGREEERTLPVGEWRDRPRVIEGMPVAGKAAVPISAAAHRSYRALKPDLQKFFRTLALSPCVRLSVHAAAALGGCTVGDAERALTALRDHHLLLRDDDGRYRFRGPIREFAAARSAEEDSATECRRAIGRLFDYYLHVAGEADRLLQPFRHRSLVPVKPAPVAVLELGSAEAAFAWLELEWRNIVQALQYAGTHEWKRQCADLTDLLVGFADISGYWEAAVSAHTLALRAARDLADPARIARASLGLSVASQQVGRREATLMLAQDAANIYRGMADDRGLAEALDQIGLINQRAARSQAALAYFEESRTLYRAAADQHGMAGASSHAAIACWQTGHYQDAMNYLSEALTLYKAIGDPRGEAKTLNNLGKMQLHSGLHRDALESFKTSLKIFTEIGGAQNQAILHHNIGGIHKYKGRSEEALAAFQRALAIYRDIGDLPDEADVLNDIGAIYQSTARYDEALLQYQQARLIAQEVRNAAHQVIALRGIADVRRECGRFSEALDTYHAALELARRIGDPYEEAQMLTGIAETTLSALRPHEARILFRQALGIFHRLGVPEAEHARIRLETTYLQAASAHRNGLRGHPNCATPDPVRLVIL